MKGYQEYFSRAQHSSYPQQYIDYSLHKSKLKQFYDRRRQLSQILKSNDGTLSDAQFKGLTGGLGVSGSHADLGVYFQYGEGGEHEQVQMVDVEDAQLRLSIMERKGELSCMPVLVHLMASRETGHHEKQYTHIFHHPTAQNTVR